MRTRSALTSTASISDRADDEVMARVARDIASGDASGVVRGTPTLFIDGVLHTGGHDADALLEAVART